MYLVTLVFGACLIVLGLVGYFATDRVSMTALIPTWFGIVFVILGALASKAGFRKHAMHAAAALAVLGLLGTIPGVIKLFRRLGGAEIERPEAAIAQSVMAVLCVVFIIFCVRSFRQARRNRAAGFDPVAPR